MPAAHRKIRGLENHYHPWVWVRALFPLCFSANSPWSVNRSWESLNRVSLRLNPRFPELWKADSCPPHRPVLVQDQRVPCLMSGSHVDSPTFPVFSLSFFAALRSHLKGQVIPSLLGSKTSNVFLFPKPSWALRPALQDFLTVFSFFPIFLALPRHQVPQFPPNTHCPFISLFSHMLFPLA